jgi:hypothetical protein
VASAADGRSGSAVKTSSSGAVPARRNLHGRAKQKAKKIDGMPSLEELSRSRKAARKEAVAEKKAAAEAEQSLSPV